MLHPMMHVPGHGLPSFMTQGLRQIAPFAAANSEAGGALSGSKDDASVGLPELMIGAQRWVWNDLMRQWQIPHALVAPYNTLSSVATKYGNVGGWKAIRSVPQNQPIVGPEGTSAYVGDVILVPNLSQPAVPYGDTPTKTADNKIEVPATDKPPADWPVAVAWPPAGTIVDGDKVNGSIIPDSYTLPTDKPADWPSDQPWPPTSLAKYGNGNGEKFWTPTKMWVAGGVGVVMLGGVAYLIFRKKRRKNPRRRRAG